MSDPLDDGLPTRRSGPWAREKLFYLQRYMSIFSGGMKYQWPERAYLDLLAGPGVCEDEEGRFLGSPLLALNTEPPFTKVILFEEEESLAATLRARIGRQADVRAEDSTTAAAIDYARREINQTMLALAFVDNLGLDVPFSTLHSLTSARHIDLAITIQVGDLTRNLENVLAGRESGVRWEAFFGTSEWRSVAEHQRRRGASAGEIAGALVDYYCDDRLRSIGYEHVAQLHRLMKNSRNVALYRLVLAGKHERAKEFFEKISKIEFTGQRRFW